MQERTKSKVRLKREYEEFLRNNHPEAFEDLKQIIRTSTNNLTWFYMNIQRPTSWYKYLLSKKTLSDWTQEERLSIAYIWYLHILLDWLTYDNIVNFQYLKDAWVKDGMINICKRKFKEQNIIKKHWWYFYANPNFWIKWDSANPNLFELFKEWK